MTKNHKILLKYCHFFFNISGLGALFTRRPEPAII
jgi:hypothetical protein